jgi:hypothetical protein
MCSTEGSYRRVIALTGIRSWRENEVLAARIEVLAHICEKASGRIARESVKKKKRKKRKKSNKMDKGQREDTMIQRNSVLQELSARQSALRDEAALKVAVFVINHLHLGRIVTAQRLGRLLLNLEGTLCEIIDRGAERIYIQCRGR